jgi:dTDP-4-amino-4,6-dideoxygalactose transaminase
LGQFENNFSAYLNVKHAIGVGNGYDALFLSLKALNIGKGDEVVLPANTFVATALAVINVGATPILLDCDPKTFTIDYSNIEYRPSIKALIPVHLFGMPANMELSLNIAQTNQLHVVEDFAQAHGAVYKNKKVGSFGICNATSFYPIKPLGAMGDGGMVTTSSDELALQLKKGRNYGSVKKYQYESLGVNSRLDDFQAGLLDIKLSFLDVWNNERRNIASIYLQLLKNVGDIQFQEEPNGFQSVYHIFAITTSKRDALKSYLEEKGIHTQIHYPQPFHQQAPFDFLNIKAGQLKNTENLATSMLSLPIYPGLDKNQIEYICNTIVAFYSNRFVQ